MDETLLDAVERIRPVLERCAPEAEAERALPHEAYDAMIDAGLFRMLAPRAFGGMELHPAEILRVIDALQTADKVGVALPADWRPGDRAIIPPSVSNADAQAKFPQGFETIRPYLRTVDINA